MFAVLRILVSVGFPSLGVIIDRVIKMFGFDWIEEWHPLSGFFDFWPFVFTILMLSIQTISFFYLLQILSSNIFIGRVSHFASSPCG